MDIKRQKLTAKQAFGLCAFCSLCQGILAGSWWTDLTGHSQMAYGLLSALACYCVAIFFDSVLADSLWKQMDFPFTGGNRSAIALYRILIPTNLMMITGQAIDGGSSKSAFAGAICGLGIGLGHALMVHFEEQGRAHKYLLTAATEGLKPVTEKIEVAENCLSKFEENLGWLNGLTQNGETRAKLALVQSVTPVVQTASKDLQSVKSRLQDSFAYAENMCVAAELPGFLDKLKQANTDLKSSKDKLSAVKSRLLEHENQLKEEFRDAIVGSHARIKTLQNKLMGLSDQLHGCQQKEYSGLVDQVIAVTTEYCALLDHRNMMADICPMLWLKDMVANALSDENQALAGHQACVRAVNSISHRQAVQHDLIRDEVMEVANQIITEARTTAKQAPAADYATPAPGLSNWTVYETPQPQPVAAPTQLLQAANGTTLLDPSQVPVDCTRQQEPAATQMLKSLDASATRRLELTSQAVIEVQQQVPAPVATRLLKPCAGATQLLSDTDLDAPEQLELAPAGATRVLESSGAGTTQVLRAA